MKYVATLLLLSALILAGLASGMDYVYFSNEESSLFGDRVPFTTGDTLQGPVRTNDQFHFEGSPVFYDDVYGDWTGGDPIFHGEVHPASNIPTPNPLPCLRQAAAEQGHFIAPEPGRRIRILLDGGVARLYSWASGTIFDSLTAQLETIPISSAYGTVIFIDASVDIKGILSGRLSIGCSRTLRIIDNVRYSDAETRTGVTSPYSPNLLLLASESDIKVANTPQNGRENSGGHGDGSSRYDSAHIVITAALYAMGESFTFEDQNDPDSCYVCDCSPDQRGTIYLFGGLVQERHGFTYRNNNGGTGYHLQFRYDRRFAVAEQPCGGNVEIEQDSLIFGDVPVDSTVWDTLEVHAWTPSMLGSVLASPPFTAVREAPYYGSHFNIPVSFTPPRVGTFYSSILVFVAGECISIYARGRGVASAGPPLTMDVSPNPFNLTTTVRYTLPAAGDARLTLFNVLGQAVREVDLSGQLAGTQLLRLNATDMATGVYFVHLQMDDQTVTQKILLVK